VASTEEHVAEIRRVVPASLRRAGRAVAEPADPRAERADRLERAAAQARRHARTLRLRAERLAGCKPWRG